MNPKITPKINNVLADIRQHLEESILPVQSITNPNVVAEDVDALDQFMAESAAFVARETGLSEDEALDVVFQVAESGETEGALPPLPAADATVEEIEEWLDAATETGFAEQAVMSLFDEDDQDEAVRITVPPEKGSSEKALRDKRAAYVKQLRKIGAGGKHVNDKDRGELWARGAIEKTAGAVKKSQRTDAQAKAAWDAAKAKGEKG